MRGPVVILVHQMQIGAGAVVYKQRLELLAGYVPLQVLVICQVFRRMLADVGVDVLGCLLPADTKALYQVSRCQPAFPPGHRLDQAIA
ncbi:hypothetical protein D9M69_611770 [compost metagenome]